MTTEVVHEEAEEQLVRYKATIEEFWALPESVLPVEHDTLTKRKLYEQNGVREYWIVDPWAKTIAQMIRRGEHFELAELAEGDTIKSVVLDGFETTVGALVNDR